MHNVITLIENVIIHEEFDFLKFFKDEYLSDFEMKNILCHCIHGITIDDDMDIPDIDDIIIIQDIDKNVITNKLLLSNPESLSFRYRYITDKIRLYKVIMVK